MEFSVFEYVEQGPIMKLLSWNKTDRPPLSEKIVRRYARDLINGLDYCMCDCFKMSVLNCFLILVHKMKVIHRDLKRKF